MKKGVSGVGLSILCHVTVMDKYHVYYVGLAGIITRTAPLWVQNENSYYQATPHVVSPKCGYVLMGNDAS